MLILIVHDESATTIQERHNYPDLNKLNDTTLKTVTDRYFGDDAEFDFDNWKVKATTKIASYYDESQGQTYIVIEV